MPAFARSGASSEGCRAVVRRDEGGPVTCRRLCSELRLDTPFCPRSSVRSERHRAKVEGAGATPAVDAILPLCLSSHRTSFVNSYSSVRVRPEAPVYGDHDVT